MSVQVLFIINKYCIYLYSTSTDRYANVDVGVLLYHIERYPGIIILTTNLIDNIDKAFFRRLRYILQLDIPPRELRAKIWKVSCTGWGHRRFINKASVLNSEDLYTQSVSLSCVCPLFRDLLLYYIVVYDMVT